MGEKCYVIWDTRRIVGDCAVFWGPDRSGYTCDLSQAGLYLPGEAQEIERRRSTDVAIDREHAFAKARLHVMVSDLRMCPSIQEEG